MNEQRIVLASANPGKIKEFGELLAPLHINIVPQQVLNVSSIAETGLTFVENAIIKARHACAETGLAAIADDSGIEVDALNGQPGIYSARFAGENASNADNNAKLLRELANVSDKQRGARYQCVLVYMRNQDDPTPLICQASWQGQILREARGEGGFGYDPLFWLEEQNSSAAELSKEQKNALSHRGKAMRLLLEKLQQTL